MSLGLGRPPMEAKAIEDYRSPGREALADLDSNSRSIVDCASPLALFDSRRREESASRLTFARLVKP